MESINQFNIKYRPRKWEEVFGQDPIVKSLKKRIKTGDYGKAIIFEGLFGCGKTTLAELYAAAIMSHDDEGNPNWKDPQCKTIMDGTFTGDVVRLDGGIDSSKSAMVDTLLELKNRPLYSKNRVIIIEEADQLSGASINALLKTLEDPCPWNHFILLSMMDKKGIPPAIKSRCQTFKIRPLEISQLMMGMKSILEKEGLWGAPKIPQEFFLEGLSYIASVSNGSMRNAVQFLEQCVMNEAWTLGEIKPLLDVLDETAIWEILDALLVKTKDETVLRRIIGFKTGDEVDHFLNYSVMLLSEAILCKETGVAYEEKNFNRLMKMGSNPNCEDLYYCLTLHPQLSKGYVRGSDLVGCLACYYQGVSFKPGGSVVPSITPPKDDKEEPKLVFGDPNYKFPEVPNSSPSPSDTSQGPKIRTRVAKSSLPVF